MRGQGRLTIRRLSQTTAFADTVPSPKDFVLQWTLIPELPPVKLKQTSAFRPGFGMADEDPSMTALERDAL